MTYVMAVYGYFPGDDKISWGVFREELRKVLKRRGMTVDALYTTRSKKPSSVKLADERCFNLQCSALGSHHVSQYSALTALSDAFSVLCIEFETIFIDIP